MGCDIHIIAEVKKDGKWVKNTEEVFKATWFNPESYEYHMKNAKDRFEKGELTADEFANANNWYEYLLKEFSDEPSSGRNYDWFAILADVRNGRGFAGVKTGAGFDVIAEPRDLPDDISSEGLKYFSMPVSKEGGEVELDNGDYLYYASEDEANRWMKEGYSILKVIDGETYVSNPDYHSASYLTVEDFDNFDWNQVTIKYGVVPLKQYEELRGSGETPETWSGGISGGNVITIPTSLADEVLSGKVTELTRNEKKTMFDTIPEETRPVDEWDVYVGYEWGVVYSEWFKYQIDEVVEPLRDLAEKYEDARIVFAFDN